MNLPAEAYDIAAMAATRRAAAGRMELLLQAIATFALFCLGGLIWVCQPKYAMGTALIIPVSPPQVLFTFGAGLAILILLLRGHGRVPFLFRPGVATTTILFGIACVLFGTALYLRPSRYLLDVLQFLDRWMLPYFTALVFYLAITYRAPLIALLYGIGLGLIVTVTAVELAKRGIPFPVGILSDGRYSGFLNHPNQYGIVISCTAPFLVCLIQDRRIWNKALAVVLLAFYALALAQSLSKTNFALFPLAVALTFLIGALGSVRSFIRAVCVVSVLCVLMLVAAWAGLQVLRNYAPRDAQIVEESLLDPGNARTVEDREDVWGEAKFYIHQSPLLGKGPGWSEDNLMVNHAHNLYLQTWLDAGLAGFIGTCVLTLGVVLRLGGVAREVMVAGWPPSDRLLLQTACSVGMLISILGNSMSSSFHTGTFVPFSVLLALSLFHPALMSPPDPSDEADQPEESCNA